MYPKSMLSNIPAARIKQLKLWKRAGLINRKQYITLMGGSCRWAVRVGDKNYLRRDPHDSSVYLDEKVFRTLFNTREEAFQAVKEWDRVFPVKYVRVW